MTTSVRTMMCREVLSVELCEMWLLMNTVLLLMCIDDCVNFYYDRNLSDLEGVLSLCHLID